MYGWVRSLGPGRRSACGTSSSLRGVPGRRRCVTRATAPRSDGPIGVVFQLPACRMAASSILHAIMSCSAPTPADVVPTLAGHPRRWSSGVQVPHAFEHPGQAHPCVVGALDGHVELAPPRRFGSVDVPVDVDCGRRYSPEPQMAEGQRWVGGVQARDDLVLTPSRARSGGGAGIRTRVQKSNPSGVYARSRILMFTAGSGCGGDLGSSAPFRLAPRRWRVVRVANPAE